MKGRIEPFYKGLSDPVGEIKSINTGLCVKCCDRDLHGGEGADERSLEESCQGGLPGGGNT